jgi:enterochelin esterase-like enzyme
VIRVLELSLLRGAVPTIVSLAGGAALVLLLRGRCRHGLRWITVSCAIAVVVTAAGGYFIMHVWRPFPDRIPNRVLAMVAFGLAGCALAVGRWPRDTWRRRALAAGSAATIVLTSALGVNCYYGQYRTVRGALGLPPANQITMRQLPPPDRGVHLTSMALPLAVTWHRPRGLPGHGRMLHTAIPAPRSGFVARPAWVYIPPAYLVADRPRLPVLVLLSGLPGSPRDWIDGGRVDQVMDGFARKHDGLAPVVVIPDDLGAQLNNPLCLNSRLGQVETYLAEDVPAWVREHLEVDEDFRHWAIGGFSHGGTCAFQLGVRRPDRYPTFLDISGQQEPTLGDRPRTVAAAFGGDNAAFERVNPLSILATQRSWHSVAIFVSGRDDPEFGPQQRTVRVACAQAGMTVEWVELPGGHTWTVWRPGLVYGLRHVAPRMGLVSA